MHSDQNAVGLTAAFAKALDDDGISCNVVAGAYHDHIFVPIELAGRAEAALRHGSIERIAYCLWKREAESTGHSLSLKMTSEGALTADR